MSTPDPRPGLDLSRLSPGDAVVALRSYPRRYRALLTTFGDDERPDDLLNRPGIDGCSALVHAEGVAEALAVLAAALRSIVRDHRPVLAADAVDVLGAGAPLGDRTEHRDADAVLDRLSREAMALADQAGDTPAHAWARTGSEEGDAGRELSALDVLRAAVRRGAEGLRTVDHALAAARRA